MMKRLSGLGCAAVLLVSISAHAEDVRQAPDLEHPGRLIDTLGFGGKLGLGLTGFAGEDADTPPNATLYRMGWSVGAFASIRVHEHIALQMELLYATRGANRERDGVDTGPFKMSYIDVPIVAQGMIPVDGTIEPYVLAGPRLGFLLSSKIEYMNIPVGMDVLDVKESTTKVDVGLLVGAGAMLDLEEHGALVFEARYDHGLRSIDGDDGDTDDIQNRAVTFMIGYRYRLGAGQPRKAVSAPSPAPAEPPGPNEPQAPAAAPESPAPQTPAPDRSAPDSSLPAPAGSDPQP